MYNQLQRYYWIALLAVGITFVITLTLLFTQPLWMTLTSTILFIGAAIAAWMLYSFIFGKLASVFTFDVQIVPKDGRMLAADQVDYVYSNLLYKLTLRHPNSRFGWIITTNQRPVLYSSIKKNVLEQDITEMQDFRTYQVVFREEGRKNPAVALLFDRYSHALVILNDDLFGSTGKEAVAVSEILQNLNSSVKGIIVNSALSPRLSPSLLGNIDIVYPRLQRGEDADVASKIGEIVSGVLFIKLEKSAFVRWYGKFLNILGGISLSDNLIEMAHVVPFQPIRDTSSPAKQRKWIVAVSGNDQEKVPAVLRGKTLVLQQIPGVINPGVLWAANIAKSSPEPFIVLDFDGRTAGFFRQTLDDLPSTSFTTVRVPAENPDYILNLMSVWAGIADEYRGTITGVLFYYLQKWIEYVLPKETKNVQENVAAMLQGMLLVSILSNQQQDLSTLSTLANVTAPLAFLDGVRSRLVTLVYQHDIDPFMSQVWQNMTALGEPIHYENTLAAHPPSPSDLNYYNILQGLGTRFIGDAGNVLLSQSESRHNPAEFNNVVFDLSEWTGKVENLFLEHILVSLLYLISAKRALGFQNTHLLVSGISSLKQEAQEVVTAILGDSFLSIPDSQYLIITDKSVLPGYVAWAKRRILSDVYLFRIREVGGFTEWLSPIKIIDSLFTLPKSIGYLMRVAKVNGKSVFQPANVVTGIPKVQDGV